MTQSLMTPAQRRASVEVPIRMRTLARDPRGFPIPFIVMIDKTGTPQFTINDMRRTTECRRKGLCAICGKRFERHPVTQRPEMWFVGGSRCFLHELGAFLDPPLHLECAEYALVVCPFLAARSARWRNIDDAKLSPGGLPEGMAILRDKHVQPDLPERFGLGRTYAYKFREDVPQHGFYIVEDWSHVEWWRGGERIEAPATGESPPIQEFA